MIPVWPVRLLPVCRRLQGGAATGLGQIVRDGCTGLGAFRAAAGFPCVGIEQVADDQREGNLWSPLVANSQIQCGMAVQALACVAGRAAGGSQPDGLWGDLPPCSGAPAQSQACICVRRKAQRGIRILVARVLISGHEDPALAQRARAAGASGFLGKSASIAALVEGLQRVAHGDVVFDDAAMPIKAGATARQLEVLTLVALGHPNKRIALELGIAERTVKLHVTALLEALGASNRTHLLVRAREQGLL